MEGIDVDDDGHVYVVDSQSEGCRDGPDGRICDVPPPVGTNRLRKFDPAGQLLGSWGGFPDHHLFTDVWIGGPDGDAYVASASPTGGEVIDVTTGVRRNSRFATWSGTNGVAVDRFGAIWSTGSGLVRRWTPGGNLLASYSLFDAGAITVDRDHVYVVRTTRGDIATFGVSPAPGSITGSVVEDGSGVAIPGAYAVAFRASDLSFVGGAVVDGDGHYALDVPAGEYLVEFADPSGTHQFEWFDDQTNPSSFTALAQVGPGSTANAVVHSLTGSIAGTVAESGSGGPIAGAWVVATGPGGMRGSTSAADGTYRIDGLGAGAYTVVFIDPSGDQHLEFFDDSPDGASPVEVTPAHTTIVDAGLS